MHVSDATDIRNAIAEVTTAFNAGDVDRMMRFYANSYDDVNLAVPRQTWAERRDYYRNAMAGGRARLEVSVDRLQAVGDLAYVWGDLVFTTPADDGGERELALRYLEIWRRFEDGWKSVCGMNAEARPPEAG